MTNHNNRRDKGTLSSKSGQTLIEYAMVLALISVMAIGVMASLGTNVKRVFSTVSSQITMAGNGGASAGSGGSGGGSGGNGAPQGGG